MPSLSAPEAGNTGPLPFAATAAVAADPLVPPLRPDSDLPLPLDPFCLASRETFWWYAALCRAQWRGFFHIVYQWSNWRK